MFVAQVTLNPKTVAQDFELGCVVFIFMSLNQIERLFLEIGQWDTWAHTLKGAFN